MNFLHRVALYFQVPPCFIIKIEIQNEKNSYDFLLREREDGSFYLGKRLEVSLKLAIRIYSEAEKSCVFYFK